MKRSEPSERGEDLVVPKGNQDEVGSYYAGPRRRIEQELAAYKRLSRIGVRVPKVLFLSTDSSYLIKEPVAGPTATELLVEGKLTSEHLFAMLELEQTCRTYWINLDYFPSNFVISPTGVWYLDYELNDYSEEWNFRNWAIYYWLNSEGMALFHGSGDARHINEPGTGRPRIDDALERRRLAILLEFEKRCS